jgi:hypothetical protein
MAIHTSLPIYVAAMKLLDVVTESTLQMRRDAKKPLGEQMMADSLDITTLIQTANMEQDKMAPITEILRKKSRVETLLQISLNRRAISPGLYGLASRAAVSVGQQAIGWRRNSQQRQLSGSQGNPARA